MLIAKTAPGVVRFVDGAKMYFGSSYGVVCEAPEFRVDAATPAYLSVESDGSVLATRPLVPDPLRRGVRHTEHDAPLSLEGVSGDTGRYWLCARIGSDVVFRVEVMVFASGPDSPGQGA